jgi:phosphoribosylformimino-5-aminoimidazole carboxamide ribotide isomerase
MEIIPAIDIIEGKCVRLTQGDYQRKTVYNEDPLEVALQFQDAGLSRLHLVDLDGARTGEVKNWKVLEKIATKSQLVIDFSGGISSQNNLEIAFNSGADLAAIGSLAIKDEFTFSGWLMAYGPDRFIIAADVKDEMVVIKGWTEATSFSVFELVEKYRTRGVKQFFCTDVNRDGLLEGPAITLYKKILNRHPSIDLIASGGVSSIFELEELRQAGCSGAIIGKAIYENRISLKELERFIQ